MRSSTAEQFPAVAATPATLTFDAITGAHFERYGKPGHLGGRVAVPVSKVELAQFRELVVNAETLAANPKTMWISAEHGVLYTAAGKFEIHVGTEKISTRTCRASITPFGDAEGPEIHLRWERTEGRALSKALEGVIDANLNLAKPVDPIFFTGRAAWWWPSFGRGL